jgi:glutamine amidotransferase
LSAAKKVAIIDYGLGNLFSVKQMLLKAGADAEITSDYKLVLTADAVVLPGVGAFGEAMKNLKRASLDKAIYETMAAKKKFLGVCLGLQLLFDSSEEFGSNEGLGLIQGNVKGFPERHLEKKLKRTQIAWNKIRPANPELWRESPLRDVPFESYMYFVHSYYVSPVDQSVVLSNSSYEGFSYCSSIIHENIFATQFHPEKSGVLGLSIYKNWLES